MCSVMMMSILKAYFTYGLSLACSIPTVTLEGEKSDWGKLLSRVDKLDSFGEEPRAWAAFLRPILRRFVGAFDGEPDVAFWQRVCHVRENVSGPTFLSGWLSAFCVWTSEGQWQGPRLGPPPAVPPPPHYLTEHIPPLVLDGVEYTVIGLSCVPSGYCDVPVVLGGDGDVRNCVMVAGHLASRVEGELLDALRPLRS